MTGRVGPRDNKRAGRAAKSSGARGAESTPCHERFHEPVHHLCARGGLPLDTLSTVPLCTRPAQVGGRGGSRRAHLFTGSTVVVSAPHGGPRPWPRPADEGVARTCGAAEQRLDSVLAGQPRPRGDTYSAGLGGGGCLFRHRTAHKARRRTRLTTSCRGGCRGLAELGFESLGARGGSQLPAHASETGPKRPATRRGGTRPTGVQYFSARGEKCARLSCTHAAV